ncbi:GldG family protein [Candidatus Villigracilis saccharophilus]|uniref:GldG family protein n=1 Tax=Candidatus Villigracilis saccharophilus TaxID=3140684 RepID=UPI0031366F02|nr:GldG family protein [Anaerolineales bacterium]
MEEKKRKPIAQYAFIGLIVASIACLSTGLLGVTKGLVALQMFTPQNPDTLNLALQISAGVLILGLAAYAFMAPDKVRRFFTGRQARYGSNSLIMTVAFVGIVFVANYIVYQNPKSWDLTEDKSHTLAPETLQALATLPENVTATAFFSASLDSTNAQQILQDFKANSSGKFDFRFVDPDLDPVSARTAGITGDGKIMLTMGERKEIAANVSETELTTTLIRLINPDPRVVYFLEGHGESGIEAGTDLSFSIASSTLQSKNYTVNTLNLLVTNNIPEDALSIIIAGPKKPLSKDEVNLLKNM